MLSLIYYFIGQLQSVDCLSICLKAFINETHYDLYHIVISDYVLESIPSFVDHCFFSSHGAVNFEHLPLLSCCDNGVSTVSKIVSGDAFESHGGMGECHTCCCVDLFLLKENWDEMSGVEPQHIVNLSKVGA